MPRIAYDVTGSQREVLGRSRNSGNADFGVASRSSAIERRRHRVNALFDAKPTRRANHDDRNPASGEILLVFQILAGRDERFEPCGLRMLKQLAVRQRAPARLPWPC